jgi:hypothetical protein
MDSIFITGTFFIDYFYLWNRKKFTYKSDIPSPSCTLMLCFAADFSGKKHMLTNLTDVALNSKPRH